MLVHRKPSVHKALRLDYELLEPRILLAADATASTDKTTTDTSHTTTDTSHATTDAPQNTVLVSAPNEADAAILSTAVSAANTDLANLANSADFASFMRQIFGKAGTDSETFQSALEQLRQALAGDGMKVALELRSNTDLQGRQGAYTASAPDGVQRIYLNADWLQSADSAAVKAVILEELGHAMDHFLNGDRDSAGDEGELFSDELRNQNLSSDQIAAINLEDDHFTTVIDGTQISAEGAITANSWAFNSTAFSADNGTSSSDEITNVAAQTVSGTFLGTPAGGEKIYWSFTGSNTPGDWSTATISGNTWSASVTLALGTGKIYINTAKASAGAVSLDYTYDNAAPSATLTTTGSITQADNVSVQSSETGIAYLVKSTVTVTNVASITGAADADWNQVSITAANTATNLSAAGLSGGTYYLYTMDTAGNLSARSTNSITVATNAVPTLTAFTGVIDTTLEDTQVELTFAELAAKGNQADSDGSVAAFVVTAVSTGTLKIGTSAATATDWAAGTNDVISSSLNAYWTPAADANGVLTAFTVKARDNLGAVSTTGVDTTVSVTAVNDKPVVDLDTGTAGLNRSVTFTEVAGADTGANKVAFTTGTTNITDVDSANLSSLTISFDKTTLQSGDQIWMSTTAIDITTASATGSVLYNGTTFSYALSDSGNTRTLTFTSLSGPGGTAASAAKASYEALIDALAYNSTSNTPTNGSTRVFSVQANDGSASNNLSDVATFTVTIASTNDAPVLKVAPTYTDGIPLVSTTPTLSLDFGEQVAPATATAGLTVDAFVSSYITDLDPGASYGIAITGISKSGGVTLWYKANDTASWVDIGNTNVTTTAALHLDRSGRLYFMGGNTTSPGAKVDLTFVAWDESNISTVSAGSFAAVTSTASAPYSSVSAHIVGTYRANASAPVLTLTDSATDYTENGTTPVLILSNITITDADAPTTFAGGYLQVDITTNKTANDRLSIASDTAAASNAIRTNVQSGTTYVQVYDSGTSSWINIGTVDATSNGSTGSLLISLNNSATVARTELIAKAVRYANVSEDPSTLARTVVFKVNDSKNTSTDVSVSVNTIAVNDAPTLTGTGTTVSSYTLGNTVSLFSGVAADLVESADLVKSITLKIEGVNDYSGSSYNELLTYGGGSNTVQLGATVTSGTTLTGTTYTYGMSVASGTYGSDVTLTVNFGAGISTTALKSFVESLGYKNTASSSTITGGPRYFAITSLQDTGGTANSGVDTTTYPAGSDVTATFYSLVTIKGANTAPILEAGSAVSISDGSRYIFSDTLLKATDLESGPSSLKYFITSSLSYGVVEKYTGGDASLDSNWTAVATGQTTSGTAAFTQADITAGYVRYRATSAGVETVSVTVCDYTGAVADGGSASKSISITVTALTSGVYEDGNVSTENSGKVTLSGWTGYTSSAGTYGNLSIVGGQVVYTVDSTKSATQALADGQVVYDYLTLTKDAPYTQSVNVGDGSSPLTSGRDQISSFSLSSALQSAFGTTTGLSGSSIRVLTDFQISPFTTPVPVSEQSTSLFGEVRAILNIGGVKGSNSVTGGVNFIIADYGQAVWSFDSSTGLMVANVNFANVTMQGGTTSLATYLAANSSQLSSTWNVVYTDSTSGNKQARLARFDFNAASGGTSEQVVAVKVTGVNDTPVISVLTTDTDTATKTETNAKLTASGTLSLTDVDTNDKVNVEVYSVSVSGTGAAAMPSALSSALINMLTLTGASNNEAATGSTHNLGWNFDSDVGSLTTTLKAFDYLPAGKSITLTYVLKATDTNTGTLGAGHATTHNVTITINGTDDLGTVSPTTQQGTVQEDTTLTVSNVLTVSDVDDGEAVFVPATITGKYGTFSILANGSWTYVLNNSATVVQNLNTGDRLTDENTFTVTTAGGQTATVTIVVLGLDEPAIPIPPTPVTPPAVVVEPPPTSIVQSPVTAAINNTASTTSPVASVISGATSVVSGPVSAAIVSSTAPAPAVGLTPTNAISSITLGAPLSGLTVDRPSFGSNGTFTVNVVDMVAAPGSTFTATMADGSPLPAGMKIDPATGQISGTVPNGVSAVDVRVLVTTPEGSRSLDVKIDLTRPQTMRPAFLANLLADRATADQVLASDVSLRAPDAAAVELPWELAQMLNENAAIAASTNSSPSNGLIPFTQQLSLAVTAMGNETESLVN